MSAITPSETSSTVEHHETGKLVCDHLLKAVGDRLQQMTNRQYNIYCDLISEMSATMTGRGAAETEGQDAAWDELARRARGLIAAIDSNNASADTRHFSSYEEPATLISNNEKELLQPPSHAA